VASHVRTWLGVPVFSPRIRFGKVIRNARMWVDEPLFPGYFFAQFESEPLLTAALATYAIPAVVKLSDRYAVMPDELISQLRQLTRATADGSLGSLLVSGGRWRVTSNTGDARQAVILQILPGRERVERLLKFLQADVTEPLGEDKVFSPGAEGLHWLELVARVKVLSGRRSAGCEVLRR
jgi:hypothetical protein